MAVASPSVAIDPSIEDAWFGRMPMDESGSRITPPRTFRRWQPCTPELLPNIAAVLGLLARNAADVITASDHSRGTTRVTPAHIFDIFRPKESVMLEMQLVSLWHKVEGWWRPRRIVLNGYRPSNLHDYSSLEFPDNLSLEVHDAATRFSQVCSAGGSECPSYAPHRTPQDHRRQDRESEDRSQRPERWKQRGIREQWARTGSAAVQ